MSDFHTYFSLQTDVYVNLNSDVIPNHGNVLMSDVGSTDGTALLCHNNHPPPPNGDWLSPDRFRVAGTAVMGFTTTLGSMVVRLKRTTGDPPEGIYQCIIADDTGTFQTVYVGLYSSGRGKDKFSMYVCSTTPLMQEW